MIDVSAVLSERIKNLNRIRSDSKLYDSVSLHYASSKEGCVDFINDWGMTQDPRLVVPNIPFILFPRQIELIESLHDHYIAQRPLLIEKTRDVGATWLCCAFAAWLMIFHDDRAIGFGSRKEDLVDKRGDPKCIFEKLRFFIYNLPDIFRPAAYEDKTMTFINHSNGSTISGEMGDNIGRGGRTSIYFIDEAAFLERAEKIDAALSMNTNVKIYLSTPNGNGNVFYRKRFSKKIDVFTFNWRDDPRKTQAWYDQQVIDLDPVVVAQEIDIDYDASVENSLIPAFAVDRAQRQDPIDIDDISKPVILGVDPARFGSDRTAIVCRQGRIVHFIETFRGKRITEIVGIVVDIVNTLSRSVAAIFVDEGGLGAGVLDGLYEHYDFARGVQFGAKSGRVDASDKRSDMWLTMREWFEDSTVSIPNDDNLKTDLCSLQYSINSSGEYKLEKKEDAKKRGVASPDIGDALCLTFAHPVTLYSQNFESKVDTRNDDTGY